MSEKNNEPVTRQDVMDEVTKLRDTVDRWRVKVDVRQDKHEKALFGNGVPGLDEEVRNIKKMLDVLIRLAWIVATSIISVSVVGIISVIIYLVKVMP